MAEFKKWISYLYAYHGEVKGSNVGFARVEERDGMCRLTIGVKGAYGCDEKGLEVGLYIRQEGRPQRIPVGRMSVREGRGEFEERTPAQNLFGTGVSLAQSGGLWLRCQGRDTLYLASWEKTCLDVREFLGEREEDAVLEGSIAGADRIGRTWENTTALSEPCRLQAAQSSEAQNPSGGSQSPQNPEEECFPRSQQHPPRVIRAPRPRCVGTRSTCPLQARPLAELPPPSLWESLCRYYPKVAPELRDQGVELLQIRPADIRYLPRELWYYGSNSFLLHGYYHYKYLVLGRIWGEEGESYLLGVPGRQNDREQFSAQMFGFEQFLSLRGQEGYWYTCIPL